MKTLKEKLLSVVVGLLVGIISWYLITGWYNVIPWAAIALLVGYFSKSRNDALVNNAIFGYFLFLAYILIGYQGKTDASSILKFVLFDFVFSLVGAIIGLVGGSGGFLMKKKTV